MNPRELSFQTFNLDTHRPRQHWVIVFQLAVPLENEGRKQAVLLREHALKIHALFYGEGLGLSNPRLFIWGEGVDRNGKRYAPRLLFNWQGPYSEAIEKRLQERDDLL